MRGFHLVISSRTELALFKNKLYLWASYSFYLFTILFLKLINLSATSRRNLVALVINVQSVEYNHNTYTIREY